MLYQLGRDEQHRDVWWIRAARDATQHALAGEAHRLLQSLPSAHEHIFYTAPTPSRRRRTRSCGRPTLAALTGLDLPAAAAAYLSGPAAFMTDIPDALVALGVEPDPVHRAVRCAAGDQPRASPTRTGRHHTGPRARREPARRSPSPAAASSCAGPAGTGPAGAGRHVRRPDPVVAPYRGLPHLHHADPLRRRSATRRPARAARSQRVPRSAARSPTATSCSTSDVRPSPVDGGRRRWTPTTRVSAAAEDEAEPGAGDDVERLVRAEVMRATPTPTASAVAMTRRVRPRYGQRMTSVAAATIASPDGNDRPAGGTSRRIGLDSVWQGRSRSTSFLRSWRSATSSSGTSRTGPGPGASGASPAAPRSAPE